MTRSTGFLIAALVLNGCVCILKLFYIHFILLLSLITSILSLFKVLLIKKDVYMLIVTIDSVTKHASGDTPMFEGTFK